MCISYYFKICNNVRLLPMYCNLLNLVIIGDIIISGRGWADD